MLGTTLKKNQPSPKVYYYMKILCRFKLITIFLSVIINCCLVTELRIKFTKAGKLMYCINLF